ncbi:MAG TPA: HlyD family efflux transporter periplasmic adaptor subunit [Vicinamibacterales bacterium]|nr:HlyD family efflux transporter periplasmic adaptor subunit [Vicinamibacterales bacterium]
MDIQRDPAILRRKKIRQALVLAFVGVGVVAITAAVMQLEPAAPTVPKATVWSNTVKRGPMVRSVNGAGTLVPEDVRLIPALAPGRVERIILRPGAQVEPGTVILELSNPDLQQQVATAELNWIGSVAQLENQRATLQTQRLQYEIAVEDAQSAFNYAVKDLEAYKQLASQGLIAELTIQQKQSLADQARNRLELSRRQLAAHNENEKAQMAPQEATVSQQRAAYDQAIRQYRDLQVRSNMSGVLQEVSVEIGQSIALGTALARVTDPKDLKAVIRISETQTRDLRIGLPAVVDTRNGKVRGHVTRIDPASQSGTVGVDVVLDEPLPAGARPDLSVDGTIELERLEDVLYVESPAFGQENSVIQLYKVMADGSAIRVPVRLGRRSVQYVEVVEGLAEGDVVILNDMSQYDAFDRVRIN